MSSFPARPVYRVTLGLGSNLGDRRSLIERSLELIEEIPTTTLVRRSDFLEYEAEGVPSPQPKFLNGVIQIDTELLPLDFLEKLQIIERRLGRETKEDRSPRPIDIDILSYGPDILIQGKTLVVPHPRLHERRFVLEPLVQIDPEWIHPRLKKTAQELLSDLERKPASGSAGPGVYENHPHGPRTPAGP